MKLNHSHKDGRVRPSSQARRVGIFSALSRITGTIQAMLREIFDESAYRRFLDRNGLESSVSAYAIFSRENEQAKARRPRCC
jgi:hypothetical protein